MAKYNFANKEYLYLDYTIMSEARCKKTFNKDFVEPKRGFETVSTVLTYSYYNSANSAEGECPIGTISESASAVSATARRYCEESPPFDSR